MTQHRRTDTTSDRLDDLPAWLRANLDPEDDGDIDIEEKAMGTYTSDDWQREVDALDAKLTRADALHKGLEDLEEDFDDFREGSSDREAAHEARIAELQRQINALSHASADRDEVYNAKLRRLWRDLHEERAEEEAAERRATTQADPLFKSVRSMLAKTLRREPTWAEIRQVAPVALKALGRRGGHAYDWTRQRESTMRLCKAMNEQQIATWRQTDRVPDHVDVMHPTESVTAQQVRDQSILVQHLLMSSGANGLSCPSLVSRRR
jgi:hypothetical protein